MPITPERLQLRTTNLAHSFRFIFCKNFTWRRYALSRAPSSILLHLIHTYLVAMVTKFGNFHAKFAIRRRVGLRDITEIFPSNGLFGVAQTNGGI